MLESLEKAPSRCFDLAVLDLDGVVYRGPVAVPGAGEALAEARAAGMHLAYITNNASRTPERVAAHLRDLGIPAEPADVVTSAQAAARLVAETVPAGSVVYVIGGEGLERALRERDLIPVADPDRAGEVAAVAQGYGPEMPWRQLVDGAILVRAGVPWVASNTDLTIPTDRGIGPGNGTLVRLVAEYADRTPMVAGKPERALFDETLDRVGGSRPLVIGDRLDTDILGARRVDWPSLLVLTGVTGLAELVGAPAEQRPTYLSPDLSGLHRPHPAPTADADAGELGAWVLGGWRGEVVDGALRIGGAGSVADWWRVAACTGWAWLDRTGRPVGVRDVEPPR